MDDAFKNKKIKIIIDFDQNDCNSIKSIVVERNTIIAVTSRFFKGEMLIFSKVLLKSFVYD